MESCVSLTVVALLLVFAGILVMLGCAMSANFELQERVSVLEDELAQLQGRPRRNASWKEGKDAG